MTLKNIGYSLLALLTVAVCVQFAGLWYTSSSGNSKWQLLREQSTQMDGQLHAYESTLLSTMEVQNQCASAAATQMGLGMPVDIQKIGIQSYAPFAVSVSECLMGFIESAAKKDPYMYQVGVGMLLLQNLKSAALSSAGALNKEQLVKSQNLLRQAQPFLKNSWEGSESFWKKYFEQKKTMAAQSGFGFFNAGAIERVEKGWSDRQVQQEQLEQKWKQLQDDIVHPEEALKRNS